MIKNWWKCIKEVIVACPWLYLAQFFLCVIPVGLFSGWLIASEQNLINAVQTFFTKQSSMNLVLQTMIVYMLLHILSSFLDTYLSAKLENNIYYKLLYKTQNKIVEKKIKMKYQYFESEHVFDVVYKMGNISYKIFLVYSYTNRIILNLITFFTILWVLLKISPLFALLTIITAIISFVVGCFAEKSLIQSNYSLSKANRKKDALLFIFASENPQTVQAETRAYGSNKYLSNYVTTRVQEVENERYKREGKSRILYNISRPIPMLLIVSFLIYVAINAESLWLIIGAGGIVAMIQGMLSINSLSQSISQNAYKIVTAKEIMQYYNEFMNFEERIEGTIDTLPDSKEIKFEHVSFTYPDTKIEVLHDLSFNIKLEEHTAIVGENGSGKSTLIKLLLGLYEPTSGSITMGGKKITKYSPSALKELFGVQYQDFYSFPLKIREVISIGDTKRERDDDYLKDVLKRANAQDIIKKTNVSLDSMIGRNWADDAVELSGGESQRLSLSSSMVYKHNCFILDEPTASLDADAESKIYEVFLGSMKKEGSLIISHRLASSRVAERILVFSEGRLVEDGSHKKLMAQNQLYFNMFNAQSKLYNTGENGEKR